MPTYKYSGPELYWPAPPIARTVADGETVELDAKLEGHWAGWELQAAPKPHKAKAASTPAEKV